MRERDFDYENSPHTEFLTGPNAPASNMCPTPCESFSAPGIS
jgi:hypothetical protein